MVYRCAYISISDIVAIPVPGCTTPVQYSGLYLWCNLFLREVWVPDWSLYIRITRAKLLSSRRCAVAVILTGYTGASSGIGSHAYAVGENSTTYLAEGTTIPACPCALPHLVEGRDAAFSVCFSCASSISIWLGVPLISRGSCVEMLLRFRQRMALRRRNQSLCLF